MTLVLCPGIHPVHFTAQFLKGIGRSPGSCLVFPAERLPVYSPNHVSEILQASLLAPADAEGLVFIAFSAGVVGAIGAAHNWYQQGGRVKAFLAFDGWGVALHADFPIYRFSHDLFTHWSSGLLGQGDRSFYANPPVDHLDLWRSPQQTTGYLTNPDQPCTTAEAVEHLLAAYAE